MDPYFEYFRQTRMPRYDEHLARQISRSAPMPQGPGLSTMISAGTLRMVNGAEKIWRGLFGR